MFGVKKTRDKEAEKSSNYKWVIIVLCFLMVMISLGFASSTKSLFPDEIAKELGVERSLVSIGESCRYIATAIVNIFFGVLIGKFGAKKLICAGMLSLISATFIYSIADNIWLVYLAGSLLGIGFSWTTTTMVGYVVNMWCSEKKGTIMGAILAANGLGGAVAIRIVGNFIDPDITGSYRAAYRMISAVLAVTAVVLLIFFKDKPKDERGAETGSKSKKAKGGAWNGIAFSAAVRKPYFWGALVCIFFSGLILQGSHGIFAMHLKDQGMNYGMITSLMSLSSLVISGSKFLTGYLYDKKGLRLTASVCTALAIISTFMLALINNSTVGYVLAIAYSIIMPIAMPLETVMLPLYASDLFGAKDYAKILGIFVSVNVSGYAVGSPVMNLCYDVFGSYIPALITVSSIMAILFIVLQFVISAAHREELAIEEACTDKINV